MNKFWLSICIPTYNGGNAIYNKIASMLEMEIQGMQIVVSDNASTDGSIEALEELKNSNLKIIRNDVNQGYTYNVAKVLFAGEGEYILSLIDKDDIDIRKLDALKIYLNKYKPSVGYCHPYSPDEAEISDIQIFQEGFEALSHVGIWPFHPSGYLYKREYLDKIPDKDWYCDEKNVQYFPHSFLASECAMQGKGVLISLPLLPSKRITTGTEKSKSKSFHGKKSNIYFDPQHRYDHMIKSMKHMDRLSLIEKDKDKINRIIYKKFWWYVSTFYPNVMKEPGVCEHYGLPPRIFTLGERIHIAKRFLEAFVDEEYTKAIKGRQWYIIWSLTQILKLSIKYTIKKILGIEKRQRKKLHQEG